MKYVLLLLIFLVSCNPNERINDGFAKYFAQYKVRGSVVVFDMKRNSYTFFNKPQYTQAFTPASTFKICNSLIGLETGVIKNEHFVIPWDSIKRKPEIWNQNHDLAMAFKNSTVWYYQELARRVGGLQMKYLLDKAQYGNADTSGGIDRFWLTGGLRITPQQQIDFLERLYSNQLPFSQRSIDIVKRIMIMEQTPAYVLRAKTGMEQRGNEDIGWYVGYITTKDDVYFFATCLQNDDPNNSDFANARIAITRGVLHDLKII